MCQKIKEVSYGKFFPYGMEKLCQSRDIMIRLRLRNGVVNAVPDIRKERWIYMKKGLTVWQMTAGLVLCGLVLIAAFLPRYALNAGQIGKVCGTFVQKNVKGLLGGLYDGKSEADAIEKEITDELENIIDDMDEKGIPHRFSDFYLATHSLQQILFKIENDEDYQTPEEMMEDIEEHLDTDKTARQMKSFIKNYNYMRVYVISLFVLVVFLLLGILLAGLGKLTKWVSIALAWVLLLMEISYVIVAAVVLPAKIGKTMPGFMGFDLSAAGTAISRKLIWCLHGPGFYLGLILAAMFLVWSIWCCIYSGKRGKAVEVPSAMPPIPAASMSPLQPIQEMGAAVLPLPPAGGPAEIPQSLKAGDIKMQPQIGEDLFVTMPEQGLTGRILGGSGTIMGAEILLNGNEKIIVGRNPAVSQLILRDAKVSRKHCLIQYNPAAGRYHVECYSKNGVHLSDNRTVAAYQSAEVERGTKITMADGREVLLLG